ncbi:MAG: tetratricopeptide repeat protein, partial [Gammaproteobacteria bacterium]
MLRNSSLRSIKHLAVCACLVLTTLTFAACSSRQERAQNYYESGVKYLGKHEYAKARVQLKNALQLKDDMLPAWRALSKVEEHGKNLKAYAGTLRRIVELDGKDFKSRVRLAKLYLLGGAVDDALKTTNAAAKLDPTSADVHALKAAVLFKLKDTDGARREAHKALEIEPGNVDASVVLAVDHFVSGDMQAALKQLSAVRKSDSDNLGVIALKLSIYTRLKEPDHVESLLKQLVKLHPNQSNFRLQLVKFYLAQK